MRGSNTVNPRGSNTSSNSGGGGGGVSSVAWKDITDFPPLLDIIDEPVSVNPNFDNTYKGGVTITENSQGIGVESSVAGWGNSGAWDNDNTIAADGAVSFIVTSVPSSSEQMIGFSYKNSESDATSLTYKLIDYAWYFRAGDSKAYVREADSNGASNHNVTAYTAKVFDFSKVFGINRIGNKINYLIDGGIVYTSTVNSTGTLYVDLAFNKANSAFSQIRIQRNLTNVHDTKISYDSSELINKPPVATNEQVVARTNTTPSILSIKQVADVAEALISEIPQTAAGAANYRDLRDRPNQLIAETVTPATRTGGEFIPNNDNSYKRDVTISDGGSTITSDNGSSDGWNKGSFSTSFITGDGYVSAKPSTDSPGNYYLFGLSNKNSEGDATTQSRDNIDYGIYFEGLDIKVRENGVQADTAFTFNLNSVYKVKRTGTVITYLRDDVVFYTSTIASIATQRLYLDICFYSQNISIKELRMLDTPLVETPESTVYSMSYNNSNFKDKPTLITTYKGLSERPSLIKENSSGTWYISYADITGTPDFRNGRVVGDVSYLDLADAPPIIRRTVIEEVSTGGEFTPTFDSGDKVGVTITDNGSTITSTVGESWNNSAVFSDQGIPANTDGYVSFEVVTNNKSYMVGLNVASTTPDLSYVNILYALYIKNNEVEVYESGQLKGNFPGIYNNGSTYKVKRTGIVITYLKDDVVFYTSARHETGQLWLDASFLHNGSVIKQVRMLRSPLVITTPRSATYNISYNDLSDKPTSAGSVEFNNITGLPSFIDESIAPAVISPQFNNTHKKNTTSELTSTGAIVRSTHSNSGWGNSGAFSNESIANNATGFASFKVTNVGKVYAFGISAIADASSSNFNTIDYAIRLDRNVATFYQNGTIITLKGREFNIIVRVGDVITIRYVDKVVSFLQNTTVVPISPTVTTGSPDYYVAIAISSVDTVVEEIKFDRGLGAVTSVVLDYEDPNVINRPKELQEVRRSYSAENNMVMAGAVSYEILPLRITITPKRATSTFVISFDIKATAPIGHIFSFSIYVNDTKINRGGIGVHNIDAVVPVPTTSGGISVLNSVIGSVETPHPPVLESMTVQVYAWYHKDSSATDDTSTLTLNRAKSNISGLTYKMQGTSMLRVQEIEA